MIYKRLLFSSRRRGFTLLEIMVVTGISVMLMTVGAMVYSSCLRIYRESQGLTEMYQTSKVLSRDLKDYLGSVVPLKGKWINPIGNGPGMISATDTSTTDAGAIDRYYLLSPTWLSPKKYTREKGHDSFFSWNQHRHHSAKYVGTDREWEMSLGSNRNDPIKLDKWAKTHDGHMGVSGWWMPGFFGRRAATVTESTEADDVMAGSWGWPRPDYRLDADAGELGKGDNNTASIDDGGNLACWFYAEERFFNSAYTLALDNPNIVLVSMKFSRRVIGGREETKLSFLRHQILGFDIATQTKLRADHAYGNMLRSIKIIPYFLDFGPLKKDSGVLKKMGDAELGWKLNGGGVVAGGDAVPCCFDILYNLRNPGNLKRHKFAVRVYQYGNPQ